jgi:hypothetical protein
MLIGSYGADRSAASSSGTKALPVEHVADNCREVVGVDRIDVRRGILGERCCRTSLGEQVAAPRDELLD